MSGPGRMLNVLVVDDSAVVRQTLTTILSQEVDFRVSAAADALIAQSKIARERPDVIVLDLEMPRMDGLTFLRAQMATDPIPVVVCSCLTVAGAEHAMRALEEGALSIVTKPRIGVREFLYESAVALVDAVRAAASARLIGRPRGAAPARRAEGRGTAGRGSASPAREAWTREVAPSVIAIGASAGGTEALRHVLETFPEDAPGAVIVQHMPETFTRAFAGRLDSLCAVSVREAEDGALVRRGVALIAPGGGRDPHGHGSRWCAGPAGDAASGSPDPGPGRSELRCVRHAAGGDRAGGGSFRRAPRPRGGGPARVQRPRRRRTAAAAPRSGGRSLARGLPGADDRQKSLRAPPLLWHKGSHPPNLVSGQ